MDDLILINYVVFALFLTAFLIEVGIALLILLSYRLNDKLMKYLMPMWEINGTFAIFYVVDLEATYPNILPAAGTIYILPVLLAALFLIFRNAFLAYGEYVSRDSTKRVYLRVYSIATVIVAFLALSVLSSSVSGIGISLSSHSLDMASLLFNPFSLMIFVSAALLALFAAMVIFDIRDMGAEILSAVLAVVIILIALQAYPQYIIDHLLSNIALVSIPVVLIAITLFMHAIRSKASRYAMIITLFISIAIFELAEYPYLFGGAMNLNSILISSPSSSYLLAFSIGGLIVLAALISILIYVNLIHKNSDDNLPGSDNQSY
ncbi:MAG: cytochrome d ubiquinol oxidase subunit II [Candidatus Micrarchaeia archaeon]